MLTMKDRLELARKRLKASETSYRELAREIEVSEGWIRRIALGDISDPGIMRFERLEKRLSSKVGT